jgi:hypothetical protein
MEGQDKQENATNRREDVYSQVVRAGRRTYFMDVKSTANDDYYLTITESKKRFDNEGNFRYEKHKIFLYKEDFDNFLTAMEDVVAFIKKNRPVEPRPEPAYSSEPKPENRQETTETPVAEEPKAEQESEPKDFTDVSFEDLDDEKK